MDGSLYQAHFGLSQAPFNITPDPTFLYLTVSHREGLAQLSYGIRARKGFVVLTGEVGTGKTTLIHALLNDLNGSVHTALIYSAIVSPADLLRTVCEEFGLIEPKRPLQEMHDYLVSLNEFLLGSYRKGKNCALIIDESQNLSAEVLETIRLLSNFETSKEKLLQILLVGQPELAVRLNSPELRQLKQRVMLRHHLRALSLQECWEYVFHRLKVDQPQTHALVHDCSVHHGIAWDATLYTGLRLWRGAELWINPEINQGFGLSTTLGVAGFPSGEAYKVGSNYPYTRVPRMFIRSN